jgi:hypothetical protein
MLQRTQQSDDGLARGIHAQPFVADGHRAQGAAEQRGKTALADQRHQLATDAAPWAQPVHGRARLERAFTVIAGLWPLVVVSFHAGLLDLSWCGTAEAAKACCATL